MQVILRSLKTLGKSIRGLIDSFIRMQSLQTITADNFFFRVFILLSGYVSTRRQVIRTNLLIDACYPNIDENTKLFFFLSMYILR